MRKKIALIGLVVLIIGIAIVAGGYYETISVLSHDEHTAVRSDPSNKTEYTTNNMTISSGYELIVTANYTHEGLIKASDLSKVNNNTTLAHYAINSTAPVSGGMIYTGLAAGTYVFVAFNSSTPTIGYVYAPSTTIELGGSLIAVGAIAAFTGFIMLIVGLILKKKEPKNPVEDTFNTQ